MKNSNPKIAVITGAGRGSGKATALQLGKSGVSLYISDINSGLLEESLSDLKREGIEATGDLSSAFIALERAHFLGQRYLIPNIQTHLLMLLPIGVGA